KFAKKTFKNLSVLSVLSGKTNHAQQNLPPQLSWRTAPRRRTGLRASAKEPRPQRPFQPHALAKIIASFCCAGTTVYRKGKSRKENPLLRHPPLLDRTSRVHLPRPRRAGTQSHVDDPSLFRVA